MLHFREEKLSMNTEGLGMFWYGGRAYSFSEGENICVKKCPQNGN
jgi:hypothetical protein